MYLIGYDFASKKIFFLNNYDFIGYVISIDTASWNGCRLFRSCLSLVSSLAVLHPNYLFDATGEKISQWHKICYSGYIRCPFYVIYCSL